SVGLDFGVSHSHPDGTGGELCPAASAEFRYRSPHGAAHRKGAWVRGKAPWGRARENSKVHTGAIPGNLVEMISGGEEVLAGNGVACFGLPPWTKLSSA